MQSLFLNRVVLLNFTTGELSYYFVTAAGVIFLLIGLAFIYKFARPLFPARVNCWFCNQNLWVAYTERNCFDCRYCDQYNGFTRDGDYNKDIFPEITSPCNEDITQIETVQSNGLCRTCNINQQLKVQQLSRFSPVNELNYNAEIDQYKEQLERAYRLCDDCSLVLTQTLQTQHYNILNQRLNGQCPKKRAAAPCTTSHRDKFTNALHLISIILAALLLLVASFHSLVKLQWIQVEHLFEITSEHEKYFWTVAATGGICHLSYLLTSRKFGYRQQCQTALWLVIQSMAYFMNHSMLLIAAALAIINYTTPQNLSARKATTRVSTTAQSIKKSLNDVVKDNMKKINTPQENEPLPYKKKNENSGEVLTASAHKMTTRSQTNKGHKKTAGSVLEKKSDDGMESHVQQPSMAHRSQSPPPEVYQGMNNLRLGSESPNKPKNPSNYLFEKLTFNSTNGRCNNSILKPSKLCVSTPKGICSPRIRENVPPKLIASTLAHTNVLSELDVTSESPLLCNGKYSPPVAYAVNYDYPFAGNMPYYPSMSQAAMYSYSRPGPYPYVFPERYLPYGPTFDCLPSPNSEIFSSSRSLSGTSFSAYSAAQPSHIYWDWVKWAAGILSASLNLIFIVWSLSKS